MRNLYHWFISKFRRRRAMADLTPFQRFLVLGLKDRGEALEVLLVVIVAVFVCGWAFAQFFAIDAHVERLMRLYGIN